uniref:(California timema) hypothetical protein n=1 Tax=Timema californicum TaxID=61474 RepID=A0A7R9P2C4_TIMCA|nr:unnamed protein product [Timema californicum]
MRACGTCVTRSTLTSVEVCVPLLLHCITLPSGSDMFWKVIQEEFHNTDWRVRFVAVERVTVIARFMDSTPLKGVHTLQAALANAFCYFISSMDDTDVHVAQRATLYLGTVHDVAVKSLILCLETQFDSVIVDRPMVLQSLYQLHNCLSDRKILTWEFFLNRFDALFLEAQINLEKAGDIAYLRDLRNTDLNSEVFVHKLRRAHEALSQQSDGSGGSSGVKTLSASFGPKWPYKRTMSAPASIIPRQDTKPEKEKVYNRQYSAPILKRKSSRFGLGQFLGTIPPSNSMPDGHIHSLMAPDDSNVVGFLHRVIDLEEADRETMHLLVFLFMQFLSRSDQAFPSDEKVLAKSQGIVLHHLYLLLGYNQNERGFHVPPQKLRTSPVFNVFIANLPQLMDQNHLMGKVLLPTCLILLQYCPCPHQGSSGEHQTPAYSLWYLEPHSRRCWLMTLLVLLYKYQYGQQPQCSQVQSLVKIVLNTLDAQHHQCRRIPATLVMGAPPSRSRDVSQPSLGGDAEHSGGGGEKFETPPLSPLYTGNGGGSHVSVSTKGGKMQAMYHQKSASMETHWEEVVQCPQRKMPESRYSIEADETESELAAIPESPKSDSTLHGSTQASFEEVLSMEEACSAHATSSSIVLNSAVVTRGPQLMKAGSQEGESRRPVWFLGSEDETVQMSSMDSESREEEKGLVLKSSFGQQSMRISLHSQSNSQNSRLPSLSSGMSNETQGETRNLEMWPDNHQHGSPVPRPLGRQKRMIEPSLTPATTPVTVPLSPSGGAQHFPWQIDLHAKMNQAKMVPPQLGTPSVERLLPIGSARIVARNVQQPLKPEDTYGSPESPLSKMDIMTVGSPVELDSENYGSSDVTSTCSISQLEFPLPERLLTIGSRDGKEDITNLVERVRQALGVPSGEGMSEGQLVNNCASDGRELECKRGGDQEALRPTQLDPHTGRTLGKQDSYETSDVQCGLIPWSLQCMSAPLREEILAGRSSSPRRLIKQVALDSSPPHLQEETDDSHSAFYRTVHYDRKPQQATTTARTEDHIRNQRQRSRKAGLFTMGQHMFSEYPRRPGAWCGPQHQPLLDPATRQACHAEFELKQSSLRVGEECIYQRCSECGTIKEEYSDEELGLCIIVLGTFIHREPALAAPMLPEILSTVATVALNASYPWQHETNIYLPGGATSVAHQFLRCVLHQLAPNGVFVQMFQTQVEDASRLQFFRSVAQALLDFNELNPVAPLQLLLEGLNSKKSLPTELLPTILHNMACYLDCLPLEAGLGPGSSTWGAWLAQLEALFRRLTLVLSSLDDVEPMLRIMVSVLKVPGISQYKGLLDPFSKVLGYGIQNFVLKYHYLVDLCYLCSRGFTREREKLVLTRMVAFELVQAMKFKTSIPDSNFLMLVNFVLQDAGGSLPLNVVMEDSPILFPEGGPMFNTSASECMRHHLGDILEFLADFHTLTKIKVQNRAAGYWLKKGKLDKVIELTTNSVSTKEWQADWEESTTGRRTVQFFSEHTERMRMKHLQPSQGLVHYITGHGPYRASLFRRNLSETSLCCCGGDATQKHVTLECIFTEEERAELLTPIQIEQIELLNRIRCLPRRSIGGCSPPLDVLGALETWTQVASGESSGREYQAIKIPGANQQAQVESYCKGVTVGLNEDTLGGVLKSGIAQYLALEITRGNSRDNRAVARYLPWLYNTPSALQQGPREFVDCVGHIRLLSWLLLGSLTHTALHGAATSNIHSTSHCHCLPIPQEASCHITDHVQVIMAGFAEQSKTSVLHMSSLFHAFLLCQEKVWMVKICNKLHVITLTNSGNSLSEGQHTEQARSPASALARYD